VEAEPFGLKRILSIVEACTVETKSTTVKKKITHATKRHKKCEVFYHYDVFSRFWNCSQMNLSPWRQQASSMPKLTPY
jgi:hypothetical protein